MEPVGWIYEDDEGRMMFSQMPQNSPLWEPVYKAKLKREWVGLTDDERMELAVNIGAMSADWLPFMLAVEIALKEKNT